MPRDSTPQVRIPSMTPEKARPILRWLFTVAAALSLVLCVAAAVFWARSYGWPEQLSRFFSRCYVEVNSYGGRLDVEFTTYPRRVPREPWELRLRHESISIESRSAGPTLANRLGFEADRVPGLSYTLYVIIVPWWSVFLIGALCAGGSAAWLWRDRSRRKAGLCPLCGYDLRATPHRCPECGAVPTTIPTRSGGDLA